MWSPCDAFRISCSGFILAYPLIISASLVRSCDLSAINQCILILGNGTDIDMVGGGIAAIPSAEQLKKMCR